MPLARYVAKLEAYAHDAAIGRAPINFARIASAVDGEADRAIRLNLSRDRLREWGAFFSGEELGETALRGGTSHDVFFDPTAGIGDLLLAASRHLDVHHDIRATLAHWSKHLFGYDTNSDFIAIARARLVLEALRRGAQPHPAVQVQTCLSGIRVADALVAPIPDGATHIVMNPPYGQISPIQPCNWSRGSVSRAAYFLEFFLQQASAEMRITAILPDVLRSGTRYSRWRQQITEIAHITDLNVYGRFDSADVDVFVADLKRTTRPDSRQCWVNSDLSATTVNNEFEIRVGPVVPYRHRNRGPWRAYVEPKMLRWWTTIRRFSSHIRWDGRTVQGPFVVIRRTSAPGDTHRAASALVIADDPVAVENHLLIALPRDGRVSTCRRLITKLSDTSTNTFLNNRIRCRHLTVSALGELPWC